MTFFAIASPAPEPKSSRTIFPALLFATIILGMAIAQLFHFEDFVPLVETFNLPGGLLSAHLFASCIVVLEVASLPFLLRMRLSVAMRFVSMVSGWLVVALWLAMQFYLLTHNAGVPNSGLLGTVVDVAASWTVVIGLVFIGVLSGWVSWGMWPLSRRKN